MKVLPINRYRFYQSLQPLFLLKKITSKSTNGCLQVFTASFSWSIYVEEGKVIYACYSDKMFELLYKHLQRLSQKIPTLPYGIKEQIRAVFETGIENQAIPNPDYLAICWLVKQKYLTPNQAGILIEQLTLEVLEAFLLLKEGSYEFIPESFLDEMPKFCHLDMRLLVECCQKRSRRRLEGNVSNPSIPKTENHHLNQSHPQQFSAMQAKIPTQEPLPKLSTNNVVPHPANNSDNNRQPISSKPIEKKLYTVFCIDDSPLVVNAIKKFLDDQIFAVTGINNPLKALMQIIRVKPDIILLDIEMPNLDGYELCSLVRKHSHLKTIPIVIISSRNSFIDKAKAKFVGASGYLNKPFTQADLLKTIFKYIE